MPSVSHAVRMGVRFAVSEPDVAIISGVVHLLVLLRLVPRDSMLRGCRWGPKTVRLWNWGVEARLIRYDGDPQQEFWR